MTEQKIHPRLEKVGLQKTFIDQDIPITKFKNIEEKRKLKNKIRKMFDGQMIRSIITPKEIDRNIRLNKLERMKKGDTNQIDYDIMRVDSFSKKNMQTISTFPSVITLSYITLLTQEGDKVYDPFMGHNSRAEDVVSSGRKYYSYEIHTYPFNFTKNSLSPYKEGEDYELNLGSSEKIKYENESFDFAITCPPYMNIEKYNELYKEKREEDLSGMECEQFFKRYTKCLSETYRVLKKNAYFVIVVGDAHKMGKIMSLMLETVNICLELGFILHDINIYNRKSNIGGDVNYKMFILTCKRFPTIHEYILIFRKDKDNIKQNMITNHKIFQKILEVEKQGGLISIEGAKRLLQKKLKAF